MFRTFLVLSTLAITAHAGPVPGIVSFNSDVVFPATVPSSLVTNQQQSDTTVFGYLEQFGHVLGQAIPVDIVTDGAATYNTALSLIGAGGNLPAGMHVASYFLHFDPAGANKTRSVQLQFEPWMAIRGIQLFAVTMNTSATNVELKIPGVTYETGFGSGLEITQITDSIQLIDSRTITINFRNSNLLGIDDVRILVETPEPSYVLLMAPALGLLLWFRRRALAR